MLSTVVGTVVIDRFAYHRRGQANLHPADGVLNLPVERYSHGLRQLATAESARGSFHEARDAIARATGLEVGNHQVEQLAQASASTSMPSAPRKSARSPNTGGGGHVRDGKGVVMRPDALRPSTAQAAAKTKPKLHGRLSKED